MMREHIRDIALAELGGTWPRYGGPAENWCGAFVAWVIGQAGLRSPTDGPAMGKELVSWLGPTLAPQVGDIALHRRVDHFSIVVGIQGRTIRIVEGRNYDYRVSLNHKVRDTLRFYTIDRLLEEYEFTGANPGSVA